jgi:23S rRNA (uracil1939-C5)-methyltransferase
MDDPPVTAPATASSRSASASFEIAEIRIESVDDGGRGVAYIDGETVLIDRALDGEHVAYTRLKRRRRFNEATLVEVLEPSAYRVLPSCPHFAVCGGCRFQHLARPEQRRRKEHAFADALSRHGVPAPAHHLAPLWGTERGYRRKARLGVRHVPGKGGALVGFHEKRGSFVAEIKACEVLVPSVGRRIAALRALVSGLDARDRIPQIEVAAGENAVALVIRHLDPLSESDRGAIIDFARRQDFCVYLQPKGPDSLTALWPEAPPELLYTIPAFGLELAFGPGDFVQVNAEVNRQLVAQVVDLLNPADDDSVLDLYCGLGNFSLALARRAGAVLGIEFSADTVAAAGRNAARNGSDNVRFRSADLDEEKDVRESLEGPWDKLLLDPPRSGAGRVVGQLRPPYPSRIVYVSCNPQSFAQDAAVLLESHPYRMERAGIVDMFPHTNHVEIVGLFVLSAE